MTKRLKRLGLAVLFFLSITLVIETKLDPPLDQTPLNPSPQSTQSPLPKSHIIKMTFVPQAPEKNWDQPWQDTCEEAALLTSVYYLKNQSPDMTQIKQDILDVLNYESSQSWPIDINLSQISQIATDYFSLQADISTNPSIADIKKHILNGTPVLATANGKVLYRQNKHFKNGGPYYHALTILGYNDRQQQFIVHDVGTKYGAYFTYSYDVLMESIHDLPLSGDKHDINQGRQAILVLSSV